MPKLMNMGLKMNPIHFLYNEILAYYSQTYYFSIFTIKTEHDLKISKIIIDKIYI